MNHSLFPLGNVIFFKSKETSKITKKTKKKQKKNKKKSCHQKAPTAVLQSHLY